MTRTVLPPPEDIRDPDGRSTVVLSLRVPADVADALHELAGRAGVRGRSALLARLAEVYVRDHADRPEER